MRSRSTGGSRRGAGCAVKEISLVENDQPWDLRQDYVVDSTHIRAELGYAERVDPDEALRRTIQWERTHPPGGV